MAAAGSKKIIFDTDPGTDDAMALMLALNSPELDVRASTVVPGNVTAKQHVDVETRGEFTRGETVANRHGYVERNVLHGDRYIIEGLDQVQANAKVCTDVEADRFLQMFVSRIQGK